MTGDGGPVCGACGAAQRSGAAFCNQCGARLEAGGGAGAHEGEVKQVTIMFVDIVGSMGLSERLGADAWRRLLERFFALAAAAVDAVDGTVDKFTGDGIMAIFGAPIGQEDHADRACLAALRLHGDLIALQSDLAGEGVDLRVRIGLNSGEVVVGGMGSEHGMSYTAIGYVVGLAARMESLAPPGSTAVSAATATLVRDRFDLALLHAEVAIKGTSTPQQVHELRGRATVVVAPARTALVGRGREQGQLATALDAAEGGSGRVVALVGEPGVGKTRLADEVVAEAAGRGIPAIQARVLAYGRQTPLQPVLQLMRSAFAVTEGDDPEVARERIAQRLGQLSPAFAADRELVWDFLGLTDAAHPAPLIDPEARERRLVELVEELVLARTRMGPLVILVEDLHWMDLASGTFVAELARTVPHAPVLLLLTYRPEYAERAREDFGPAEIPLGPLTPSAVDALLGGLLGPEAAASPLARRVADRAGGNPFFCEELVQALVDAGHLVGPAGARVATGDAEVVLPTTVQSTLAARIDGLGAADKQLVLAAAVLGRAADRQLLDRVSGLGEAGVADGVGRLLAGNLLVEQREDERVAYRLRHPLIQEVAYRGQVLRRRDDLHGRAADALAELHAAHADEYAALIAHHAEGAGRHADAAQWHARAATWAAATSPAEAMRHWQTAKNLADGLPAGGERDGLAIGARLGVMSQAWRLRIAHEVAQEAHSEAVAMLPPADDDGLLRVLLEYAYSANLTLGGRIAEGLMVARDNTTRAARIGDPGVIVLTAGAHWYGALTRGYVEEGFAVAQAALEAAGEDTRTGALLAGAVDHPYALCLYGRGYCAGFLGDVAAGMADIHQAIALAQEEGTGEVEPYALSGLAFLQTMIGDGAGARADAEAALRAAEHRGNGMALNAAWLAHVWAGLATGDHELAAHAADEMLEIGRTRSIGLELLTFAHGARAEIALAAGDAEAAVTAARASITAARTPAPTWGELLGLTRLGRALLARDGPAAHGEAAAAVARAHEIADRHGIRICDRALAQADAAVRAAEAQAS